MTPQTEPETFGNCIKCGTPITYPPLCDNDDCVLAWKGYWKALAEGPDYDEELGF